VVPLHVVGREVVVPVAVVRGHDALRQVRDRHVRIAMHAAIGDGAIVPMVMAFERVVHERVAGDDGEDVADARVVVDVERVAGVAARDLVVPAAAREVVLPRDRKSTRLNSSHSQISYAVFCLKKKKKKQNNNLTDTASIQTCAHPTNYT